MDIMDDPKRTLGLFVEAFSHLRLEEIMKLFSSDSTSFFPIKHKTTRLDDKSQIRTAFKKVIEKIKKIGLDKIDLPVEDLRIQKFETYALATFHIRDNALSRRTLLLRKDGDRWLIQHLHASNAQLEGDK
jgi:hypothetical protein